MASDISFTKRHGPAGTSEILDRTPPYNLDAERGVIGSLILDPTFFDDVLLKLRSDDFYDEAHQILFGQMAEMHNDGIQIDVTLLVERLKGAGQLDAVGGMAYLAEVAGSVGVAAHAEKYADVVRDKSTLRGLIHASSEILRDAYDPTASPSELIGRAEQKVFAVGDARSNNQISEIRDILMETVSQIDHRIEHGGASGLETGFVDLDNLTGGFHPSEFIIIAARPSMGKTAFATNVAEYVAIKLQEPVLFVSLEMAAGELAQRLLASQGKIDSIKFRSGHLSKDDRQKMMQAAGKLSESPLFVDDSPNRTISEIAAAARRIKRNKGLALIVIDYLQLIQPDNPKDPRQEQVAKIARRLKGLSRELKVPIACLAQLNRQVESGTGKESRRPRLSHLRESGAIEQDADVVMFVHREEYFYHTKEEAEAAGVLGQGDLFVSKQRNGPTGDVKLTWKSKYTRFENRAEPQHSEFGDYAPSSSSDF